MNRRTFMKTVAAVPAAAMGIDLLRRERAPAALVLELQAPGLSNLSDEDIRAAVAELSHPNPAAVDALRDLEVQFWRGHPWVEGTVTNEDIRRYWASKGIEVWEG